MGDVKQFPAVTPEAPVVAQAWLEMTEEDMCALDAAHDWLKAYDQHDLLGYLPEDNPTREHARWQLRQAEQFLKAAVERLG